MYVNIHLQTRLPIIMFKISEDYLFKKARNLFPY